MPNRQRLAKDNLERRDQRKKNPDFFFSAEILLNDWEDSAFSSGSFEKNEMGGVYKTTDKQHVTSDCHVPGK